MFSPDGKQLAFNSGQTVRIRDAATGQETLILRGHTGNIEDIAFSPDGMELASAGSDGVKVWDATTGQETLSLKAHRGPALSVAFSPDGRQLASGSGDGTLRIWDARELTPELRSLREARSLVHVLFAKGLPKGDVLAAIRADETANETVRRQALELAEHVP